MKPGESSAHDGALGNRRRGVEGRVCDRLRTPASVPAEPEGAQSSPDASVRAQSSSIHRVTSKPNLYQAYGVPLSSRSPGSSTTRVSATTETYDDSDVDLTTDLTTTTLTKVEGETYDDSEVDVHLASTVFTRVEGETYDDAGSNF